VTGDSDTEWNTQIFHRRHRRVFARMSSTVFVEFWVVLQRDRRVSWLPTLPRRRGSTAGRSAAFIQQHLTSGRMWRHLANVPWQVYGILYIAHNLIEVFKTHWGLSIDYCHVTWAFTLDENSKGTTGHSCKLVKTRFTRDITKYFFSNKVINRWNLLDQRTVDAPNITAFKSRLVCIRMDGMDGLFRGLQSAEP